MGSPPLWGWPRGPRDFPNRGRGFLFRRNACGSPDAVAVNLFAHELRRQVAKSFQRLSKLAMRALKTCSSAFRRSYGTARAN
jgi:hypothetical protein